MADVTQILWQIEQGDPSATEQLLPLVYEELRKLAAVRLAHERPGQTLQATALVHEAYLRLVDIERSQHWNGRGHFFGAAAEAMRRILVENARRKGRRKRGGGRRRVDIDRVNIVSEIAPDDLLWLDEAIQELSSEDAVAAQLVMMRYFCGLPIQDAATAVGIGVSTAYRHWAFARAWLHSQLLNEHD